MAEAQTASATASVGRGHIRGYVEAEGKERVRNRLRRGEGRVRGMQRMVDEKIGELTAAVERFLRV